MYPSTYLPTYPRPRSSPLSGASRRGLRGAAEAPFSAAEPQSGAGAASESKCKAQQKNGHRSQQSAHMLPQIDISVSTICGVQHKGIDLG
eukprot:1631838-Pleurochrysis_carterae.AAC.1